MREIVPRAAEGAPGYPSARGTLTLMRLTAQEIATIRAAVRLIFWPRMSECVTTWSAG